MEPLLPEADESAQGEAWGLGGVPGGLPLTPLSPSLVLSWVLACSGQGASQALPVIFQGKDPKTEVRSFFYNVGIGYYILSS